MFSEAVEAERDDAVADDELDVHRELFTAYARGQRPPETITVVGNAPMRPDPARARLIDDSDLVLRLTTFALDEHGEAPCYGRKTDVVVVHRGVLASPHTFADYTSRLYLLAEPGRMHWEPEWLPDWWPPDLGFLPIPNRPVVRPLGRLLGLDPAQPVWATTGTLAVYLCARLFPEAKIRMAGFSIVDDPEQTRFAHAWGADVEVTVDHRLRAESALLRSWRDEGRVEVLP
ncbi:MULTISPECIES: hypothetical protein [Amycolatopsis]|uniref:Glycosyltransferase family 29 (Sialyltransferase) n=2 Tax=Amycolatopsis TaxID=1813 RepID=A0A1I3V839_9PSEU|nr:hypothetical protein [Amycolatopsis sacchari]SFJ91465.1 hypothetical protein SAMN05421835_110191 [Amycolatopsis sacchari]